MHSFEPITPEIPVGPVALPQQEMTDEEWADEVGLIDWDVMITPPPAPSQTVVMRFVEGGPAPIRIGEDVEE